MRPKKKRPRFQNKVNSIEDWVEWAEPIAYGPLALKPWEFGKLTPLEFDQLYEGYTWRKEQQENLSAYFVCSLLNVSGKSLKHAMSAKELLKPIRGEKKQDRAKAREDMEELKKLFPHRLGE